MFLGKKKKSTLGKIRSDHGFTAFSKMVALCFPIATVAFILWNFQTTITGIPLFKLLITLGGLQTYNQGVIGVMIVMLIVGAFIIMWED